ncbi:MAG: hypothetical protein ACYSUI_25400 [Planctomycetota bacterium]
MLAANARRRTAARVDGRRYRPHNPYNRLAAATGAIDGQRCLRRRLVAADLRTDRHTASPHAGGTCYATLDRRKRHWHRPTITLAILQTLS